MENKKNHNIWWILGSIGLIILLLIGSYIAFNSTNNYSTDIDAAINETLVSDTVDNSPDKVKYEYYGTLAKDYISQLQSIIEDEPEMTIDEILTKVDAVEYDINTTLDEFPEDSTDPVINSYKEMFSILSSGAADLYATVDTGDVEGGMKLIEEKITQYNKLIPSVEPYYSEAE